MNQKKKKFRRLKKIKKTPEVTIIFSDSGSFYLGKV